MEVALFVVLVVALASCVVVIGRLLLQVAGRVLILGYMSGVSVVAQVSTCIGQAILMG